MAPWRTLLFFAAACSLSACRCVAYTREPLPARDSTDYRALVATLDRATSDVIVSVDYRVLLRNPRTVGGLRGLGILKPTGRTPSFTPLAVRESVDRELYEVPKGNPFVRLRIGRQHIERIVSHVASHGHGFCLDIGSDDDEYGYVARVDSLNALGRTLLAKRLLLVGFGLDGPALHWDGRTPIVGAIVSVQSDSNKPIYDDSMGEKVVIGDGT